MSERIDAPQRIVEAMRKLQEAADRLQVEAQAVLFGAAAALDVPDGWQWDGGGWIEGRGARAEEESQVG